MSDDWQTSLIGRTVLSLEISEANDYVRINTDDQSIEFMAEGDCCSHTWIQGVIGVENLLGQEVDAVRNLDLELDDPDEKKPEWSDDVVVAYGLEFTTQKGTTTIEYRNASNGYYGGMLTPWSIPNGTVMRNVTEDFE